MYSKAPEFFLSNFLTLVRNSLILVFCYFALAVSMHDFKIS